MYVVSTMLIGGTTMLVSHVRTELNHSIDVPHLTMYVVSAMLIGGTIMLVSRVRKQLDIL